MAVLTITQNNFEEEVMKSEIPVLIDFWAAWCGPCKMFSPIIDQIAVEKEGILKVGKINIDEEPALAAKYEVMSIPTIILFKGGEAANVSVGVLSKAAVKSFVEQ